MSQLALVGIGIYLIYLIGHGVTALNNPGAFAMIGGGICVIIAALI